MLCSRNAPPSAVGRGFGTTAPPGGSPHGLRGVRRIIAVLAVVDVIEAGAVTGGQVQCTVGAKETVSLL